MLKSSSLCLYSSNLGTFWLEIEQFWPFEEISIFSKWPAWIQDGTDGHNFERRPPKDHFSKVWLRRAEERRVGKECSSRRPPYLLK